MKTKAMKWVSDERGFSRSIGGRLLVHCFIAMFLGFIGGFVWLIALADNVFHILPLDGNCCLKPVAALHSTAS